MAAPTTDPLHASLLAWIRSFDGSQKVEDLHDLDDGRILWSILQDLDGTYFTGSLPEPGLGPAADWTRKWQNLKHLDKQLSTYCRDVCNGWTPPQVDIKAIASDSSSAETQAMIMEIIRAAMSSEQTNARMGQRLMGLGQEHAMAIAYEIRSMQEAEFAESEPTSRDESAYHSEQESQDTPQPNGRRGKTGPDFNDPLLAKEEELLQAQATIEKLQANQNVAAGQLQELRQEKQHLQDQFDLYRAEIDGKGRKLPADDVYQKMQRQAENDRDYIDDLETQLQASKDASDRYELQLQRVKDENLSTRKLRDDLQLLRAENEDLSQKLKANENLKKKIQALQEQEKTNVAMREDLKAANERVEELDRLRHMQAVLEKEIIEKKGLIRNQEYQINELTTTRKHAEYDARVLAQKLEAARERQEHDHEALEELRMRLQDSNLDSDVDPTSTQERSQDAAVLKKSEPNNDEQKYFAEKLALLEQQLEAADARLKQASQRNAALEEESRDREAGEAEQREVREQLAEREHTIADLRKELEAAAATAAKQAPPVAHSQDFASLQRENQLMTTAWYDLASRVQHNNVSVGRRRQEPKSWIGKQRILVNPNAHLMGGR